MIFLAASYKCDDLAKEEKLFICRTFAKRNKGGLYLTVRLLLALHPTAFLLVCVTHSVTVVKRVLYTE